MLFMLCLKGVPYVVYIGPKYIQDRYMDPEGVLISATSLQGRKS